MAYLDIHGAYLDLVNVRQDAELDGAAPGVSLLHSLDVSGGFLAEDGLGVRLWVGYYVVCDFSAQPT